MKKYPVEIKNEDVLLASFPRSGNTWVRCIIVNMAAFQLKFKDEVTFHKIFSTIPFARGVGIKKSKREQSALFESSIPFIVKTHTPYLKKYKRAIYIMRDPRDALVSLYFFNNFFVCKKSPNMNFSDFSRKMIEGWCRHVKSWEGHWDLLIKYEDLKRNPENEAQKIVLFLGMQIKKGEIKKSVKKASFDEMKKLQQDLLKEHFGKVMKSDRYFHVRKGEVGQWKKYFSKEDLDFYRKIIEKYGLMPLMKKNKYI
jgi:estrone sulfotransferase